MSDTQTEPTPAELKKQRAEQRAEDAERLKDAKAAAEGVALQALVDIVRTDPGTGNDNRFNAANAILNYYANK